MSGTHNCKFYFGKDHLQLKFVGAAGRLTKQEVVGLNPASKLAFKISFIFSKVHPTSLNQVLLGGAALSLAVQLVAKQAS